MAFLNANGWHLLTFEKGPKYSRKLRFWMAFILIQISKKKTKTVQILQFDVDSIVKSLNETSIDAIMIHISYYRISNNTNGPVEEGANCPFVFMFPNASHYGCVGASIQPPDDHKQHVGIGWFEYDDVGKLLDDVGEPTQWKEMFYEYYFELQLNYDYVFYVG
eukprot:210290_1